MKLYWFEINENQSALINWESITSIHVFSEKGVVTMLIIHTQNSSFSAEGEFAKNGWIALNEFDPDYTLTDEMDDLECALYETRKAAT